MSADIWRCRNNEIILEKLVKSMQDYEFNIPNLMQKTMPKPSDIII